MRLKMTHLYDGDLANMNGMYYTTDMAGKGFKGRSLVELNTTGNLNGKKDRQTVRDTPYNLRFGISNAQYFHDSISAPGIEHVVSKTAVSGPKSYMSRMIDPGSFIRKQSRMQATDGSFYSNLNESINLSTGRNINLRGLNDIHDIHDARAINHSRFNNYASNYDSGMHVNDDERFKIISRANTSYTRRHEDFTPYRSKANNRMRHSQIMEM